MATRTLSTESTGRAAHVMSHELRINARSLARWALPMAGFMVLVSALQPSMGGPESVLAAKLGALPPGVQRALGLDHVDLTRVASYVATYFMYVALVAALWGANLGANLVAKEEVRRTAELLLTQPVSRGRVLLGKAGAALLHGVAFNAGVAAVTLAGLAVLAKGPIEAPLVAAMFAGSAALTVCFAGVGMLLAVTLPSPRSAPAAAMGAVVGTYLLGALASADDRAKALAYLSPFRAVAASDVLAQGGVSPAGIGGLLAIGLACAAAATALYDRRDIHA